MRHQLLVDGECVDDLVEIFPYLASHFEARNTAGSTAEAVPLAVMAPFLRAVMRREARLLNEDADLVRAEAVEPRTPAQRRSDAVLDVITTVSAVERYQGSISVKT